MVFKISFLLLILNEFFLIVYSQLDYGMYWNGLSKYQIQSLCPIGTKTTANLFGYHGYQFEPTSRNYKYNDTVHCFVNIQGPNIWDQNQTQPQLLDVFAQSISFGVTNCSYAYIKVYRSASCTFGSSDLTLLRTWCGTNSFSQSVRDIDPIASRCVQLEFFIANVTNWVNVSTLIPAVQSRLNCDYKLVTVYQNINNSCFYNQQNDNTLSFYIDVTSYYNGICNSTYIQNRNAFQCAPTSTPFRCIHLDYRCNSYLMRGCKDFGANQAYEPSFCFTSQPNVYDLSPIWIILKTIGGILASYIVYWLLWRTGWLVWHLARFRNYACIGPVCKKLGCTNMCNSRGGCCKSLQNQCGCCKSLFSSCEKCCFGKTGQIGSNMDNSGWSQTPNFFKKPVTNDITPKLDGWIQFHNGDGGHLREQRF